MGGMIRAELVSYPSDPAIHPSRIETRHSWPNLVTYLLDLCEVHLSKIGMDGGRGGYHFE